MANTTASDNPLPPPPILRPPIHDYASPPDYQRNRLFLDGYQIDYSLSSDYGVMSRLLAAISESVFANLGATQVTRVKNPASPRNDGISGVIIAPGGHFTCHTFPERDVVFIDLYSRRDFDKLLVTQLIRQTFNCQIIDDPTSTEGPATCFGRHFLLYFSGQTPCDRANLRSAATPHFLKEIMESIDMLPLASLLYAKLPDFSPSLLCTDFLQPITTSHIAFHLVGDNAELDVYSCKFFNYSDLYNILSERHLQPQHIIQISRGRLLDDVTI